MKDKKIIITKRDTPIKTQSRNTSARKAPHGSPMTGKQGVKKFHKKEKYRIEKREAKKLREEPNVSKTTFKPAGRRARPELHEPSERNKPETTPSGKSKERLAISERRKSETSPTKKTNSEHNVRNEKRKPEINTHRKASQDSSEQVEKRR